MKGIFYTIIVVAVMLNVYGQVILKWQLSNNNGLPEGFFNQLFFLLGMLLNPWVFSGFVAVFGAALLWMAALTKIDLSYAYPVMGLSFVFILIASAVFFGEQVTWPKLFGTILITVGVAVASR